MSPFQTPRSLPAGALPGSPLLAALQTKVSTLSRSRLATGWLSMDILLLEVLGGGDYALQSVVAQPTMPWGLRRVFSFLL